MRNAFRSHIERNEGTFAPNKRLVNPVVKTLGYEKTKKKDSTLYV